GVPRRLTLPNGQVFVAPDSTAFTALLRAGGMATPGRMIAWAEVFRLRSAIILGGGLVVLLMVLRWGLPLAADAVAALVPTSVERLLGAQSLIAFDNTLAKPTTLTVERQARLTAGFHSLLSAAGLPSDISLEFRSMPDLGPNALALPGGPVILTDELAHLTENDGEVIAVLAHEVAHLRGRHSLRRVARVMGLSLMIALVVGDAGGIVEEATGVPVLLMDHAYSRDFEREADDGGIDLLMKTGRDPALLTTMLARLGALRGDGRAETTWLSTHPGIKDRLDRLPR
ncbi:MAG: M48 family metallopeptidase, partial [Rhodospirillum sp.]|nr:M48 family metallopeptidase [Rhodospirillum sp.]